MSNITKSILTGVILFFVLLFLFNNYKGKFTEKETVIIRDTIEIKIKDTIKINIDTIKFKYFKNVELDKNDKIICIDTICNYLKNNISYKVTYDTNNRIIEVENLLNGESRISLNKNFYYGVARVIVWYREYEELRSFRYTNNNNMEFEGKYFLKYKFDKFGNIIEKREYGKEWNLQEDKIGVAIYCYKYNNDMNVVEESYYGINEKLKKNNDGIAIVRYEYDENGNNTKVSLYGSDRELKKEKEAIIHFVYDKSGNMTKISLYGKDKYLIEKDGNIAVYHLKYDEYGKERQRILFNKNLKEVKNIKYDEYGNKIEETIQVDSGKISIKFDKFGNIIEESNYDTNENLLNFVRFKYDENGNETDVIEYVKK